MMANLRILFVLFASAFVVHATACAAGLVKQETPGERRVSAIASRLRCPVCQGETVYDSHSTVANQMKSLIREQVAAGRSDAQIEEFFVSRYGSFVLMEPAVKGLAIIIWAFPVVALSISLLCFLLLFHYRKKYNVPSTTTIRDTEEFITHLERLRP